MPNYYNFTPIWKVGGSDEPAPALGPAGVDDLAREHFGADPDDMNYLYEWHVFAGFSCAVEGHEGLATAIESANENGNIKAAEVITWIQSNFRVDAWYQSR